MEDKRFEDIAETGADAGQNTAGSGQGGTSPSQKRKKGVARIVALVVAAAVLLTALPIGGIIMLLSKKKNNSNVVPDTDPIIFSGGKYSGNNPTLPPELATVKVTADGVDSKVIPIDGAFIVETAGETDAETLAGYLTMTPAIPTSVTKLAPSKFRIAPASGSLAPGQIYKLTLGDPQNPVASFAFQTENNMVVTSMFPADKTLNVPVNTGIEVTFSDAVVMDGNSEPFTVSPKVKGKFSLYPDGRTVLFLPDENLSYGTVYTVTVNEGVTGRSGKTFTGEKSAAFRTYTKEYEKQAVSGSSNHYVRINLPYSQDRIYSPGSDAGFDFSAYSTFKGTVSVTCDLYMFGSAKQAAELIVDSEKRAGDESFPQLDLTRLTKIGSFSPQQNESNRNAYSVDFGNGLAAGIYLAVVNASGSPSFGKTVSDTRSVIVQVSDLRPYTVSSDGKTYLWLNAMGTGPVAGADLSVTLFDRYDGWNAETDGETKSVRTDASGIAVFDNGGRNSAVVYVEKGSDAVVICASTQAQDTYDYYMSYIFTDRETYFSDDTVNFSGYIAPSFGGTVPGYLYLQTGLSTTKTRIEVDETGFFTGSLTYSRCEAGYFTLRFSDGDGRFIAAKSFRITEEEKPQYTASASFDKLFYRRGEKITVTVKASFFDGTPAEGLEFLCSLSYFGDNTKTVKTDKNGEAKLTYTPRKLISGEVYGTDPAILYFYAELTNFETQTLMTSAYTYYFHSDYVVGTLQDANSSIMTLNRRDTSALKTAEDFSWQVFPENTKGEPLSAKDVLTYTLYKVEIIKTETKVYNSYTRRYEKQYKYSINEQQVAYGKKSFTDGSVSFPLREVKGFDGYYWYKVEFYDDTSENVFHYSLNGTAGRWNYTERNYYDDAEVTLNAASFAVNDKVVAQFKAACGAEKALFVTVANGIADVKYADKVGFTYTADMIAGGRVYAVVFDKEYGTYVQAFQRLAYDTERASLTPVITASSDTYKPGDTATVTVKVPGAAGGFAVISVVDEACFALGNQKLTPATFFSSSSRTGSDYYSYRFYDYYYGYYGGYGASPAVSFNSRFIPAITYSVSDTRDGSGGYGMKNGSLADEAAEMPEANPSPTDSNGDGSDGGWYIRQYFADNPVFKVVELDADGCGTLTFTVPDNITSWRITALALSGAGRGNGEFKIGTSVSDVVCTQPFFVNLGVCQQYIVGDTISISARSYGTAADGNVKYSAVLTDLLGNKKGEANGAADSKSRCWLKFDLTEPGQYIVTVYAECGEYRDAVTAKFSIVPTAVASDVSKTITVAELKDINPVYYPVRIVFTNRTGSYSLYERVMWLLAYDRGSGRTDEYAALYASEEARETLYGFKSEEVLENLLRQLEENFSAGDGKFRLFPYSEPDARLTASLLTLGLPLDNNTKTLIANAARKSVAKKDQTSPEDLLANIVCLAALDEPVLDTLYAVADTAANFPNEAKLWLALGFALCGDYPAAYDVYSQVKDAIGNENSEFGTLKFEGEVFDTTVSLSCLALMSASRIARDDASKIALWLCENRSDASSNQIALAGYLKYFLPAEKAEPLEFTYSIGENEESVTLESGRSFMLTLSKPELEALKLSLPDDAKVGVYYRGNTDEALYGEPAADERVKIEKKMTVDSRGNCVVELHISGKSTRVCESFELYDLIPSGARFLSLESGGYSSRIVGTVETWACIYNRSGQNMSGCVGVYNSIYRDVRQYDRIECPEYSFDITVSYVIRGAVEGHFIAESAYVKNWRTGAFSVSGRIGVDIKENGGWKFKAE
jgi:hypothetical protein